MVPEAANKAIAVYMQQFADNAVRLTAIGTAFLGATALALMLTIDKALNAIWRVPRFRPLLHPSVHLLGDADHRAVIDRCEPVADFLADRRLHGSNRGCSWH